MATPIAHIALADSVFDLYFEGKSRSRFFVGLLFPDIQYLGVIAREQLHFSHVHLNQIIVADSFVAGIKFHSLIEQIREEYMVARSVYYTFPRTDITVHALHLLEDDIYYSVVGEWKEFERIYGKILPEELKWRVSEAEIERWHGAIRQYIHVKPDQRIRREFLEWLGYTRYEAKEIVECVEEMRANQELAEMVRQFFHSFKYLIGKS